MENIGFLLREAGWWCYLLVWPTKIPHHCSTLYTWVVWKCICCP